MKKNSRHIARSIPFTFLAILVFLGTNSRYYGFDIFLFAFLDRVSVAWQPFKFNKAKNCGSMNRCLSNSTKHCQPLKYFISNFISALHLLCFSIVTRKTKFFFIIMVTYKNAFCGKKIMILNRMTCFIFVSCKIILWWLIHCSQHWYLFLKYFKTFKLKLK